MTELQNETPNDPKMRQFQLEQKIKSGANWFYWIAILSLVNSALSLTGAEWSFIVGLGATQMVDGIAFAIIEETGSGDVLKYAAFVLDIFIAGIYVVFGLFANKRIKPIFIIGMVLYAIDGLIFLLVMDILSIAFHIFVLFCIFGSLKALKELENIPIRPEIQPQNYCKDNEI